MKYFSLLLLLVCQLTLPAQQFRFNDPAPASASAGQELGYAIYYADYLHGRGTAMGEVYDRNQLTAAHRSLPLGTLVKVTRADNGRSVTVRINDKGAYCDGCAIDVSWAAAQQLDLIRVGRTRVHLEVVGRSNSNPASPAAAAPSNDLVARGAAPAGYTPPTSSYTPPVNTPTSYETIAARGVGTASPPATQARSAAPSSANPNEVYTLTSESGGYCVQLGAYREYANAQRHVVSLQQRGIGQLYVKQDNMPDGGVLHRVVVAAFKTANDAQLKLQELENLYSIVGVVLRLR